jgi:ABC-type Mn2+/Zn2+ transport system permease subunit
MFTLGGLIFSYGPDLPSGAVIIILASVTYILSLVIKRIIFIIRHKESIDRG